MRRLAPGHLLVREPGGRVAERLQYAIRFGHRDAQQTEPELVDRLDQLLEAAVRRHCGSDARRVLMLSGGRDSRLIAGYLKRIGAKFSGATRGADTDFDLACAQRVARHLGIAHVSIPHDQESYGESAAERVRWTHLAHGFRSAGSVRDRTVLQQLGSRAVSGYATGAAVGAVHVLSALPSPVDPLAFDGYMRFLGARVFPPDVAAALLGRNGGMDAVASATASARATYTGYGGAPAQAIWAFELHHHERFHVGSAPWRLALDVWPEQPFNDRLLLDAIAQMPIGSVAERRLQLAVLRTHHADLARIPFEHGEHWPLPHPPRLADLMRAGAYRRWRILRRRLPGQGKQRSYYLRLFDFNGEGWRDVRRRAEPFRPRAHEFFDPKRFDALLPGPEVTIDFARSPYRWSALQLLIGFMFWCEQNL